MSFLVADYARCLHRYGKLVGWRQTSRLLCTIIASKLGAASSIEAQGAMQNWAFFQILAPETGARVSSAKINEFRVCYDGASAKCGGVEVALRMPDYDSSDSRVFEQIFVRKDYAGVLEWFAVVSPGTQISTVLDIGANIGCSALFFCTWLPAPTVFCLEPEASNFARLLLNLSLNPQRPIRCHRAALWTHAGSLSCAHDFRDGKEWGARFVEGPGEDKVNPQQVPALDIIGLAKMTGFSQIDFLKIDIEGAEADLLKTQLFRDFIKERVCRLAVEVHEEFIKIDEVHAILASLGFQTKTISEFVCGVKMGKFHESTPSPAADA